MASAKEIIEAWQNAKYLVPEEYVYSVDSINALTDELAEKKFLDKYGSDTMFKDADRIDEPTIPSMENVIAILGLTDDPKEGKNSRTKEQKFIDDFPKKQGEWKKKIENNPVYGKRGWKTVDKIWRQALEQKRLSDTEKGMYDAVNDGTIRGWVTRTLFPRTTERIANAGDFTAKDILADIGENAAMGVPGGVFTGVAGKGLAKVAPRAVRYFSGPGKNIIEGAAKGAGRMAGNIFGNAVVPFASEFMDAALYGDDDEGMEERSDFSLGDAIVGTAINQGVNRGLMRVAGPVLDRFANGGMAEGGATKVRQAIENVGQPSNQKGVDFANSVASKLKSPIINAGELTDDAVIAARTGSAVGDAGITAKEFKEALADQAVIDAIQNGSIKVFDKGSAKGVTDDVRAETFERLLKKQQESSRIDIDDVVDLARLFGKPGFKPSEVFKIPKSVPIDLKRVTGNPSLSENFLSAVLDKNQISKAIARNPEAFINYAAWYGKGPGVKTSKESFASKMKQAVPSWAINKYGSEGDATAILSMFPETKKAIDENRQEVHDAPKKRKMAASASDILSGATIEEELTDKDRKFLSAIENNPDILKFGYKDDPNGFRLWLLEKGNDLLQNYPAFRPTFR